MLVGMSRCWASQSVALSRLRMPTGTASRAQSGYQLLKGFRVVFQCPREGRQSPIEPDLLTQWATCDMREHIISTVISQPAGDPCVINQ
jgi:hypothetical protein